MMSKHEGVKFTFTWIIENFSMCHQSMGQFFDSPLFAFISLPGMEWSIRLYPNGKLSNNSIVVCLVRADDFSEECSVKFSMQIDCNEQVLFRVTDVTKIFNVKTVWESENFLKNDSFLLYLTNDILVIKCTLQPMCQHSEEDVFPPLSYENGIFTDVVLRAEDTSFKVHKAVLWARWPKLAEKLDEKDTSEQVLDIQPNVLAAIIEYIYTGSINFSPSESLEFYQATEKYKIRCQNSLPFIAQKVKTRINAEKISFQWPIENFFSLPGNTDLYSYVFAVRSVSSCKWNLKLHILSCQGVFEIFLCKADDNECPPIFVRSKVSLHGVTAHNEHLFEMDKNWRLAQKYKIMSNSVLLECEFKFSNCHYSSEILESSCKFISSTKCPYYTSNFRSMYKSGKLSDVNIVVGSDYFPAHKFILCARSSVFSRMFHSEMSESTSSSVVISDVEPDIMDELLLFMYSGKLEKPLEETAMLLYSAADKYDVPALKKMCSLFLKFNFHIRNICSVLQLADMHSDSDLYLSALQFFSIHAREIFLTDEWKEISEDSSWVKHLENVMCLKNHRK
ncbi:speckle-type POZ protein B-like [Stegodyphus dumicola]|uniref:speckle-type POZ protein B-like n=1 Tax=Stegodyphus dumicola TaxID=202533 RepID=UPI0015A811EC|nr:speckle-type POZ protein B-like [Stegodyphus dumicola]